ncbi:MAG: hypothetical protein ABIZ35_24710, partial [Capsulimonas sp.]|uniref:hypothetical protein n=1 Tax=Capsulimonas sp. TaxID=2494211 RepID=UPI0032646D2F
SSLGEDEFDESRLRCLAVGGLIERDRLEEALEVAATIRDPFWNGNAGYRIVEGLAFAGRNAEAMDLAESYVEDSKPIALAAAAAGFARSGRFDDAGEVGARIDHIYWFEQAMADTAAALFAAGDESEALEMARSLTDSHLKSVTEAKIAEIAFQAGHEDLGISIALSVEDDCTRVELFVKLSSFKEDELSMDLLLSAYQEARDSTELMVYNSSAQLIAKGFAKRGEWEHAWSVVNTIDHNYAQSLAAAELITLDPSFLLSDTQEVWENILARFCGRRRTDMILATPVLAAILAKSTGPHAGLALFEVLREVRTEWP